MRGGVTYANLHMETRCQRQRERLWLCGREGPDDNGWSYPVLRNCGTMDFRRDDALRALRSRQGDSTSDWGRWIGSHVSTLRRLCVSG